MVAQMAQTVEKVRTFLDIMKVHLIHQVEMTEMTEMEAMDITETQVCFMQCQEVELPRDQQLMVWMLGLLAQLRKESRLLRLRFSQTRIQQLLLSLASVRPMFGATTPWSTFALWQRQRSFTAPRSGEWTRE